MDAGDALRKVYDALLGRPMNVSFVDEYVCGSARPFSKRAVKWLKEKKEIEAILTMTEDHLRNILPEGMDYKHVPVENHIAPTIQELEDCVAFLLSETGKGKKTVVHCAAGMGRTGTVLAAYLCAKYDIPAREAIHKVRALRPGSVEKNRQEAVVEQFAKNLETKKKNRPPQ